MKLVVMNPVLTTNDDGIRVVTYLAHYGAGDISYGVMEYPGSGYGVTVSESVTDHWDPAGSLDHWLGFFPTEAEAQREVYRLTCELELARRAL